MELLKNLEGMSADEQMTAVVELQKAAMKTLEDQKQASIGKSAELVIQGLKKIKSDFEAKFDSLNYDIQNKVASLKDGEQGLQGPKGEQGDRGLDGSNGRDGRDGKDGKDGLDGVDGVGVRDAKIDFDGSLVISLTDGREINCGEVVSVDVAKQIQKVTHNIQTGSGGDSQTVLDAIAALQATIATYGTMATQNKTSVDIEGGTIDNTTIGATTPSTGVFTTLTATGTSYLGGVAGAESLRVLTPSVVGARLEIQSFSGSAQISGEASSGVVDVVLNSRSTGNIRLRTAGGTEQARVSHTASAVNYVQVTGAATGAFAGPTISAQGSDTNVNMTVTSKGGYDLKLATGGAGGWVRLLPNNSEVIRATAVASNVNYVSVTGAAAGSAPSIASAGSDTNISQVFQSKGTGAIDLAAGSSGVNISNGGTVTALTITNNGSLYNPSGPAVSITAPTTAGGVQATASVTNMNTSGTPTVVSGGTGYTNGDTLTIAGTSATLTVTGVSGGVITSVASGNFIPVSLASIPANPASVTGGTGSGATFTILWKPLALTITNAGSGYVEQPTVTFSGGGGSGAAAYASVGGGAVIRSLGVNTAVVTNQAITFETAGSSSSRPAFVIRDIGTGDSWYQMGGGSTQTFLIAKGNANANAYLGASGSGSIRLTTNGDSITEQLRVAHTASAVNYVQVTGAATGGLTQISSQGSDASVPISYVVKGFAAHRFCTNSTTSDVQFLVYNTTTARNYLQVAGATVGNSPRLEAAGSDTNIDIIFTPKGTTGNVRFGTYTGTILTPTGYVEIKDSGGTVRRLLVG